MLVRKLFRYFSSNLLKLALYSIVFVLIINSVTSIKLTRMHVPMVVTVGQDVQLICDFEMDEDEFLYSIKWYKDSEEFYRFIPKDRQHPTSFDRKGIKVNLKNSSLGTVYLEEVNIYSSGLYRCEVSGESPGFRTRAGMQRMDVYVIPSEPPIITGQSKLYNLGDISILNCTSSPSYPEAKMKWFINENLVPDHLTQTYPIFRTKSGLFVTVESLTIKLSRNLWTDVMLNISCQAVINNIYRMTSTVYFHTADQYTNITKIHEEITDESTSTGSTIAESLRFSHFSLMSLVLIVSSFAR